MNTSADRAGAERDREHALAEQELDPVARAGFAPCACATRRRDRERGEHAGDHAGTSRRRRASRTSCPRCRRRSPASAGPATKPIAARRLDEPVGRADRAGAGEQRDERELGRRRDGDADAEHEREREDRRQRRGERERARDDGLEHAGPTASVRVSSRSTRTPTWPAKSAIGDQRQISSTATPPSQTLVRAEAERDHGDPVADRRDGDRAGERAQVRSRTGTVLTVATARRSRMLRATAAPTPRPPSARRSPPARLPRPGSTSRSTTSNSVIDDRRDRHREQHRPAAEEDPDRRHRDQHEQRRQADRLAQHSRHHQVVLEQPHGEHARRRRARRRARRR